MPHTVLVVDPNVNSLAEKTRALSDAGYLVTSARSFDAAYRRLRFVVPDLLVTDLRLGANNGVHLVILGHTIDDAMRAIVTDVRNDPGVASDALANGAVYMARPAADARELLATAEGLLAGQKTRIATSLERRWARKPVTAPITGKVGNREMTVLDLSYGGLRIEVSDAADDLSLRSVEVAIPSAKVAFEAPSPVWARRFETTGCWWCGLELKETSLPTNQAWRSFVDSV
jgi:ActR/RegA family two-component response regulator